MFNIELLETHDIELDRTITRVLTREDKELYSGVHELAELVLHVIHKAHKDEITKFCNISITQKDDLVDTLWSMYYEMISAGYCTHDCTDVGILYQVGGYFTSEISSIVMYILGSEEQILGVLKIEKVFSLKYRQDDGYSPEDFKVTYVLDNEEELGNTKHKDRISYMCKTLRKGLLFGGTRNEK